MRLLVGGVTVNGGVLVVHCLVGGIIVTGGFRVGVQVVGDRWGFSV